MFNFERQMANAAPKLKSVDYDMVEIEGAPILKVLPAGEINKPLFNAIQKRNSGKRRAKLSDSQLQSKARKNARELYPLHVVVGWEDVKADDGELVPFSPEACQAFFAQLPNFILDSLIVFTADMSNFNDQVDPADADETGKN